MSTKVGSKKPQFQVPFIRTDIVVKAKGSSNDDSQKATFENGSIRIRGNATNRGILASRLVVNVDGKELRIPMSSGQTPQKTQALLSEALPAGYSVRNIPTLAAIDGVFFNIVRTSQTVDVDKAFSLAQSPGSFAGTRLSVTELRRIVNGLLKEDGFSDDEKTKLANAYAGLFTGAEWNATRAAQEEYASLQQRYNLPVVPVR